MLLGCLSFLYALSVHRCVFPVRIKPCAGVYLLQSLSERQESALDNRSHTYMDAIQRPCKSNLHCQPSFLSGINLYTSVCVCVCLYINFQQCQRCIAKKCHSQVFFFWLLGSTILLPGWFLTAAQHWSVKWKPQLHDGGVLSVSQGVQQSHRSGTLTAVFNKSMMASFTCMYALATFRIFCTCRVWR